MRLQHLVVVDGAVPRRVAHVADAVGPARVFRCFAGEPVRGFFEVVGRLDREVAAGRELLRQPGVERGVVGQPLQRGVGQDHVDRLRGPPGGDVGHLEVHAGHALACGLDHVVGAVHAADQRAGKALRQHFGGVAGAAAQVDGAAHFALRQGGHEVAHGAGAFFFEG